MAQKIDFVDLYDFMLNNEVTEPVTVLRDGAPLAVLVPYDVFEAMNRKKRAVPVEDLSEDDLKAIMNADIPEELKQYDDEVKK
jgi:PHD/YefM family antitoxin component YafN of YafNO toxin-antitoxin module